MNKLTDEMIGQLVAQLEPVRPLRQGVGMARAVLVLIGGVCFVALGLGLRADLAAGRPDPMFLTSSGVFLVLALASAWGAVDMARPYVGTRRDSWVWTALMAAVLPIAALGLIVLRLVQGQQVEVDGWGLQCLSIGTITGLFSMGSLVLWLRRGAPSSPALAGTLVGVASGAAGIFAVSLCCPENSLIHIGVWHGGTVILMGLIGRLTLPRFLAW